MAGPDAQVIDLPVRPTTVDLTKAIYDFNLAYEIAVLRSLEEYAAYDLSNFFRLGRKRPVRSHHQLIAARVSYKSPLDFIGVVPPEVLWLGAGAGTVASGLLFLGKLIEVVEKVYTIPLNFKNARLRSEVENARLRLERDEIEDEAAARLRKRVQHERFQLTEVAVDIGDTPTAGGQ